MKCLHLDRAADAIILCFKTNGLVKFPQRDSTTAIDKHKIRKSIKAGTVFLSVVRQVRTDRNWINVTVDTDIVFSKGRLSVFHGFVCSTTLLWPVLCNKVDESVIFVILTAEKEKKVDRKNSRNTGFYQKKKTAKFIRNSQ